MTLRTVEALMEHEVPAYSVHDSLIVKVDDAVVAAKVFRQTIHDYCKQLSGLEVLVPLSITVADDTPRGALPKARDLKGIYLS